MADYRKAKYSGSLNLAPECGPVLIELDTEAKTATASLEDPASQYTLAGGGDGLKTLHLTITNNAGKDATFDGLAYNKSGGLFNESVDIENNETLIFDTYYFNFSGSYVVYLGLSTEYTKYSYDNAVNCAATVQGDFDDQIEIVLTDINEESSIEVTISSNP